MLKYKKSEEEKEENEEENNKYYRIDNHVYFYADINRTTIYHLIALLHEAEAFCTVTKLKLKLAQPVPIWLHIYSDGGYIHAALAAVDVIQSCSVPVHSVIEGATASAGTLISVCCTRRYIRPSAHMLIHQLSSECWGKMSEITDEYKNLRRLMKQVKKMYQEKTNIPTDKLEDLLQHDLWLNADKCLRYGLVDELYT